MKSPVGSRKTLQSVQLEDGLAAYRCPETDGHYIPAVSYTRWLTAQPARLPQLPSKDTEEEISQAAQKAYLCPETGTIMTRFRVGHGFRFTIDRSPTGGIWLDAGEWEALRSRNFHDEINFIFTEPWQRAARNEEIEASSRSRLQEEVGDELLRQIDALKDLIEGSPFRDKIIAYITNHK